VNFEWKMKGGRIVKVINDRGRILVVHLSRWDDLKHCDQGRLDISTSPVKSLLIEKLARSGLIPARRLLAMGTSRLTIGTHSSLPSPAT